MKLSHRLRALFFFVGFAAPSVCITELASGQSTQTHSVTITPPQPGQYYTRTDSGDFDGDAMADAAYLVGSSIDLTMSPGLFEAPMQGVATATDFRVLEKNGRDSILHIGAGGLRESSMNPDVLPLWPWSTVTLNSGLLAGGLKLAVWSRDPLLHYVVGLAANGRTLFPMTRTETLAGAVTWTSGPSLTLPGTATVLDLVLVDRDGSGEPEIAVMRAASIGFYDLWDGAPPYVVNNIGYANRTMARVRHGTHVNEWLGRVTTLNSDGITQRFELIGNTGVTNPVELGNALGVVSMTSADEDADTDEDLAVTLTSSWSIIVVKNVGSLASGPWFSSGQTNTYTADSADAPGSAADNRASPLMADVDGDGDFDVGMPILTSAHFWIHFNPSINSVALAPSMVFAKIDDEDEGSAPNNDLGPVVGASGFDLTFKVKIPAQPNVSGLYLQVAAWSQDSPGSDVHSAAFYAHRVPVTDNSGEAHFSYPDLAALRPAVVVPGLDSSIPLAPCFDRIVYLTMQIVQATSPDIHVAPSRAQPGTLYVFHAQDSGVPTNAAHPPNVNRVNEAYVELLRQQASPIQVWHVNSATTLPLGEDVGLGSVIPTMPLPLNVPPTLY